jgi:hypothetical protein
MSCGHGWMLVAQLIAASLSARQAYTVDQLHFSPIPLLILLRSPLLQPSMYVCVHGIVLAIAMCQLCACAKWMCVHSLSEGHTAGQGVQLQQHLLCPAHSWVEPAGLAA